jgi:ATP-dependent Clp protease ATP-binding subunit ClpA
MPNFERLTVKAGEALQAASNAARQAGNPQIEDSHLLAALLDQEEGIVVPILQKVGVNVARLRSENDAAAARLPKQSGAQPHLSRELNEVLDRASRRHATSRTSTSPPSTCCWGWRRRGSPRATSCARRAPGARRWPTRSSRCAARTA